MVTIVSFSFVNTNLRTVFRQRFPRAKWVHRILPKSEPNDEWNNDRVTFIREGNNNNNHNKNKNKVDQNYNHKCKKLSHQRMIIPFNLLQPQTYVLHQQRWTIWRLWLTQKRMMIPTMIIPVTGNLRQWHLIMSYCQERIPWKWMHNASYSRFQQTLETLI